jgi:hypothetical protein
MHEFSCEEAPEEDHQAQAKEATEARALQEEPLELSFDGLVSLMDREDYIKALLSVLHKPQWRRSNSVADWDLQTILHKAGLLATPDQVAALLSETRRSGLIDGRERRGRGGRISLWGVRITSAGEEWLATRVSGAASPYE